MSALAAPAGASPALDVRNVLWLLASMVFVVAPHIERMPLWVGAFCAIAVIWRGWIAWTAQRFPSRWLVIAITIGATIAIYVSHGRLLGRDAGVTLLVVMVAMKLLEMRTQREVILCVYLGFFLVMTNFLFSQSIPLGIYLFGCVWLFVATLIGFHRTGRAPSLRERFMPAGALLLQALPLMVVLFILFPRVAGPLWALPQDARAGTSGLTDQMTPGQISQLIQSEELAFRVQFEDKVPAYANLYWRGPVLWAFDGRTWKMPEFAPAGSLDYPRAEQPVRYSVTLEPHGKHWLFALDVPGTLPPGVAVRFDQRLHAVRPVDQRIRYDMTSYLDYRLGSRLQNVLREYALRFDETRNPRTVALGRQWARETPDPSQLVARAFAYFNREFTYTLEPPLLDERDPYDEFLFETKRGFCEHYAGSFALLMRAAGIPSRVVTGYMGGEINPFNNELIVRQADAHAWVEIWLEDRGWLRVDPTGSVSPLRVEGGVNAALGPIGTFSSLIAADKLGVLSNLRYGWHLLNSQWDQWVIGYNIQRQREFLARMGIRATHWRVLVPWLIGGILLVGAGFAAWFLLRDRPRRGEASVVAWRRFCEKLAAAGIARAPHEGPLDFLARIEAERPPLADAARAITAGYVKARYGDGATREELRALRRLVREFRTA